MVGFLSPPVAEVSPHRTKALFHGTAVVCNYDRAVERLGELIGLRVLEYSEQPDPLIGRRGGMTWIGDGSLELCEPIVVGAPPDRFLRRTGGGMQSLAIWVEDFGATVRHLDTCGAPMPVQINRRFGFTSPRGTCGLQFEWADFTIEEDPRTGATSPAHRRKPVLDIAGMAFIGAVVDDPIAAARRLALLTATEVTFEAEDAPEGEPVAGVSIRDCTLALFRRVESRPSGELWGRIHDRPRVSLLGVVVDDPAAARRALLRARVSIIREGRHTMILAPGTTAGVELAVVDRLLPGDPRGVSLP